MLPTLSARGLADHGRFLGKGVGRAGYAVEVEGQPAYCLKFATASWGVTDNHREAQSWENLLWGDDSGLVSHFAEVVAYDPDGEWVAMPLCTPLYEGGAAYESDLTRYFEWMAEVGEPLVRRAVVRDLHPGNVMQHPDGRVVITDYGFGVRTGEPAPRRGLVHTFLAR